MGVLFWWEFPEKNRIFRIAHLISLLFTFCVRMVLHRLTFLLLTLFLPAALIHNIVLYVLMVLAKLFLFLENF